MKKSIMDTLKFDVGFKSIKVLNILGKNQNTIIKFKAYKQIDGVTEDQKKAYSYFENNEIKILKSVDNLLYSEYKNANQRFTVTTLLINRNGDMALLFDDIENEDEGIAVTLSPKMIIMSQDDYL